MTEIKEIVSKYKKHLIVTIISEIDCEHSAVRNSSLPGQDTIGELLYSDGSPEHRPFNLSCLFCILD